MYFRNVCCTKYCTTNLFKKMWKREITPLGSSLQDAYFICIFIYCVHVCYWYVITICLMLAIRQGLLVSSCWGGGDRGSLPPPPQIKNNLIISQQITSLASWSTELKNKETTKMSLGCYKCPHIYHTSTPNLSLYRWKLVLLRIMPIQCVAAKCIVSQN